jgi:hypothetical protein
MDLQSISTFWKIVQVSVHREKGLVDCQNFQQYHPKSGVYPFVQKSADCT